MNEYFIMHQSLSVRPYTTRLNMLRMLLMMVVILTSISYEVRATEKNKRARKKNDFDHNSLWKPEYEDEPTDDNRPSRKRHNVTRLAQPPLMSDNEVVLEKLIETITSSEKYLKKIDNIDFRLNRLDIEVHEKTNSIIKQLSEFGKSIQGEKRNDKILDSLKNDVLYIKQLADQQTSQAGTSVEGVSSHADSTIVGRITALENMLRGLMDGVESIVSTMSEVKNRQNFRPFTKTDAGQSLDSINVISEFSKMIHDHRQKKCDCRTNIGRAVYGERYPTDCHEIKMQGFNISGIYKINPEGIEPFYILCDLTTAAGGWTVFQNRYDGSQDFYKGWSDYKYGFGNLAGEFWLGLEKLHYLTNQKLYELRVEVESQHEQEAYAGYSVFTVGPEYEGFRISTLGTYSGTAGDSLSYHAGQKFSTVDSDNDEWKDGSCATEHGGAWWYKECDKSNLNGKYSATADDNRAQSVYWISFKGPNQPLTKTKMMIRPLPASKPANYDLNRKSIDVPRARPAPEPVGRPQDVRPPYNPSARYSQYNYEEAHSDLFPNFA